MISQSIRANPDQQVLEIFDLVPQKDRKKRRTSARRKQHLLKHRLNEVVFGKRSALRVYSKALQTDFWFVNEGLADPSDVAFQGRVVTMEMLAEIMSNAGQLAQGLRELIDSS
jgi:hypothetical protein